MTPHLLALTALFLLMLALLAWTFWPQVKGWTQDAGRRFTGNLSALVRALFPPSPASRVPRPAFQSRVPSPDELSPESHHAGLYADILRRRQQREKVFHYKSLVFALIAIALLLLAAKEPPPPTDRAIVETDRGTLERTVSNDWIENCLVIEWRWLEAGRLFKKDSICG